MPTSSLINPSVTVFQLLQTHGVKIKLVPVQLSVPMCAGLASQGSRGTGCGHDHRPAMQGHGDSAREGSRCPAEQEREREGTWTG